MSCPENLTLPTHLGANFEFRNPGPPTKRAKGWAIHKKREGRVPEYPTIKQDQDLHEALCFDAPCENRETKLRVGRSLRDILLPGVCTQVLVSGESTSKVLRKSREQRLIDALPEKRKELWVYLEQEINSRHQASLARVFKGRRAPSCRGVIHKMQEKALERERLIATKNLERQVRKLRLSVIKTLGRGQKDQYCNVELRALLPSAPASILGIQSEPRVMHSSFEFDRCGHCHAGLAMHVAQNQLLCPMCGAKQDCPDPGSMSMSITYYNLDRRPSLIAHKRLIKLKDFLKQRLAQQKSVVPRSVLLDISARLAKNGMCERASQLSFTLITSTLIEMGLENFRDYATQIYIRLKGCRPPSLSPSQEEALYVVFAAIQEPFEKLKEKPTSTFFTMSFITLSLCTFLKFDHVLPFIPVTNPRTRIESQQSMLEKIFEYLKWSPCPNVRPLMLETHPRTRIGRKELPTKPILN